jgi:signal transduction histidine kinase
MQQLYFLLPLVLFLFSAFLTSLVLRSNWKSWEHRVFSLFLFAMALWGLTAFGMRTSPDLERAFAWEKWLIAVIPFVTILFYHFTLVFTRNRARALLYFLYLATSALALASLANLVVTGMQFKPYGYAPIISPLFAVYLAIVYASSFLGVYNLVRAHRRSRAREEKRRYMYIIIGVSCSLLGGTTDYLPVLGFPLYPLGIVGNLGFALLATIAILRHHLLELRVVLRNGFAYILLSTMILGVYGAVFFATQSLFGYGKPYINFLVAIMSILLVAIFLQPVLGRLQEWVDRLFQRERYTHLEALKRFSQETRDITDLKDLSSALVQVVLRAMQAERVVLMLPSPQGRDFVVAYDSAGGESNLTLPRKGGLITWLTREDGILTAEKLDANPVLQALPAAERETLAKLGAWLFVPLKAKGQLTGLLVLGQKLYDYDYSREDLELLWTVSNQAAMGLENARLYTQEMERLRELEGLERLKSTLLLTVSHELKTPITAIKTSVDLIAEEAAHYSRRHSDRLIGIINRGVDRLQRLIQESLDYAQMQSASLQLNLQPTDVRLLFEEVVSFVLPSVKGKRQTLELDLPDSLPPILIDGPRIERVLLNLLTNANKFTPVGGKITVHVRTENGRLVSRIQDTGPGIPEEEQLLLFSQYYTTQRGDAGQAGSTGLGLPIAKYLVELHGGKIWVESKVGVGSTFTFYLPMKEAYESISDR